MCSTDSDDHTKHDDVDDISSRDYDNDGDSDDVKRRHALQDSENDPIETTCVKLCLLAARRANIQSLL